MVEVIKQTLSIRHWYSDIYGITFCRRRAWRTVRRRTVGRWTSVVRNRWDTTGSWDVTGSSAGESSCTYLDVLCALYRKTSSLRSLHWTAISVNVSTLVYTSTKNEFCCQTNMFSNYLPRWKVSMLKYIIIDTYFSVNNKPHIVFLLHA